MHRRNGAYVCAHHTGTGTLAMTLSGSRRTKRLAQRPEGRLLDRALQDSLLAEQCGNKPRPDWAAGPGG